LPLNIKKLGLTILTLLFYLRIDPGGGATSPESLYILSIVSNQAAAFLYVNKAAFVSTVQAVCPHGIWLLLAISCELLIL
jgi:hypothetical protein